MKNSSDTSGNRTRDLPACSAVPQRTAPPRAPDAAGTLIQNARADAEVSTTLMAENQKLA